MPQTVLVVDDEPTIVDLVAEVLADEGYRVRRAHDGAEALDLIDRDPPDALVTDVMMPRLDGVTLVGRLRERSLAIPVVLMSAVYAGADLPGVAFLAKPFDLERLLGVLAGVLPAQAA